MNPNTAVEQLHSIDRECRHLEKTTALLQWDQETQLPPGAVEDRAEQIALVQSIWHRKLTDPQTGRLLDELGADEQTPGGDEKLPRLERDFCRVFRRNYDRAVKLPEDLVRDAARAEGLSQAAWVEARQANDFASFVPHLTAMIDFARKKARCWGFEGPRAYDGLLDLYEPGLTAAETEALFTPLKEGLSALLQKIARAAPPETSFLDREYKVEEQVRFNRELMEGLGFDTRRGRLDISVHPFTSSLGFNDIRITTRYAPANVLSSVFSTIHESGHAFYELGLSPELQGSCLAEGASMAVHESQSRLWENVIGRSLPFWEWWLPRLKARFPEQLLGVAPEAFYRAVNQVRPSLIRVDADEVSYALHIILRFELEKQLFAGSLRVEDLPGAWNRLMKDLIGVTPPSDTAGVLQDVHWSMGSFGYFPSYALGNLYGLQIWEKLRQDLPETGTLIREGKFEILYQWLREKIYRSGCRVEPAALLAQVTGEKLSVNPFLRYLKDKYTVLYGL
ncbi:MAG: carboxypeptidase M32 [Spirochaetaceae bacterium]|jgi:carboxypeptidase Taq|nr:carboxypeptidase M32 [Spirochaetaceae bacterium]